MASCKWTCYGGRNGWGKCFRFGDCDHKEHMRKAPTWLHEIVDRYYFGLRGLYNPGDKSIKAPLREKFSHVVKV